ncbi:molybdopterin containing oxidoreductase [Roseomonas sp. KE2513]|uniref:sulfite oxidase n=1 Tax=Roseomonas sp. KE2513 TaxID=2479202 RepID=UPI0018E01549|nr:sulfite oxidase [Roseomonas sp. KE2513]MBI0536993.1 molybdopterin containing oxidoreductase [Roseomonas sp. KE2513]
MRTERSLAELFAADPERAEALTWGRRGALKGASLAALGAALGTAVPFAGRMPGGLLPAALAQPAGDAPVLRMDGKAPLLLLGERPLVAETPETLLDDDVTPADKMFVRNNGGIPERFAADPGTWRFKLDGEVNTPLDLSLGELESRFEAVTLRLQMECGGNGRSAFVPETRGNQWNNGAISNCEWTGVRLRDVIRAAGPKDTARFTGHFGADPHLSGATDRAAISRGMPVAKAMEEHTLLATRMNGQPIPQLHGYPLRLIVPGWPGSLSQKWLTRIALLAEPHRGQGMGGTSYRLPVRPIVPGSQNDGATFADMTSMPVRSVLTNLAHGARLPAGTRRIELRGHAWAGDEAARAVHVSVDFGATWQEVALQPPPNRYSWQRWSGAAELPSDGYFEVWHRATDARGRMQPHVAANWNPQGYGANAIGRAAILVG